jgi:predicted hydrocarbon binding protein
MTERVDFEQAWLAKFSRCLSEVAGNEIQAIVMEGSDTLSAYRESIEIIRWTQGAMERLKALVDEEELKLVMTGCACQYPKAELQDLRREYEVHKDINLVHRKLQDRFETFLRETLALEEELVVKVVQKGWGLAGILSGDRIIATKIPKSGYLVEYLKETDFEKRRQIYCHCPRVRDALALSESLPTSYCYCGAGFYKGIWEEILQKHVDVEVLESVIAGGEVCRVAIHLPEDCY